MSGIRRKRRRAAELGVSENLALRSLDRPPNKRLQPTAPAARRLSRVILAQWRRAARDTFVSDTVNAARVVEWLLALRTTVGR